MSGRRTSGPRPSYEVFNYGLRPAKHIERRLMLEIFQRLAAFNPLSQYRYVGMGSIYFVDFVLAHRLLGVGEMISIEDEPDPYKQRRFSFNKPFHSVRMMFEKSSSALEKLDWNVPTIAWMDYDGMVAPYVFTDVATVASSAVPGTVLAVTLNAERDSVSPKEQERGITELTKLERRLPPGKLPLGLTVKDLQRWGVANVIRRMLCNQVIDTLAARNGTLYPANPMMFRQIFNFQYRDGARMVTVGFVFYRKDDENTLTNSGIPEMEGYKSDADAVVIEVPHLTHRELRYFESQLPAPHGSHLRRVGVSKIDFEAYRRFYRHYPTYAETWV